MPEADTAANMSPVSTNSSIQPVNSGGASPQSDKASNVRSSTLDNAFLLDERRSLEHADVDDDRHSLPSLDDSNNEGDGQGIPPEVLDALNSPSIEDDTPFAEALRANSEVHVPKVGKLARKVHGQSVRRVVKKATFRAKSGNVRGKPPRIPPTQAPSDVVQCAPGTEIYVVEEEEESDDELEKEMDSSIESLEERIAHDDEVEATAAAANLSIRKTHGESLGEDHVGKEQDWQERMKDGGTVPAEAEVLPGTGETGKKVLGYMDPHNLLPAYRWKRRKRKGNKERKSYVKGKVINREHELYTLSIAVILGVRTSIGTTNSRLAPSHGKRWLTSDDFMATEKYEFSPKGGPRTPPHQLSHTFKFKDYSPMAFAYLRRMFGVNEFDFLLSVCGKANFIEFISNAKSGQFFFYTSDGKYMVKTMTNVESKFLRRILPHYFRHCAENPNTMLTKFLGMYRVKMYHLRRNVKFVIMNSVFNTDKWLQTFYDLKGSVLGRAAKPHQDVKKDNDLREAMPDSAIALPPDVRARMRKQIVADTEFMRKMDIMDYSMLIGVHHIPPAQDRSQNSGSIAKAGFNVKAKRRESPSLREVLKKTRANSMTSIDMLKDETMAGALSASLPPTVRFTSDKDTDCSSQQIVHKSLTPRSKDGGGRVIGATSSSVSSSGSKSLERPNRPRSHTDDQIAGLAMYDHQVYDDDDDSSYLEGSEAFKRSQLASTNAVSKVDQNREELERKTAHTIEQMYWPFHRYYDLSGCRRMIPSPCSKCGKSDCSCTGPEGLSGLKIPSFEAPLSDRKDGGLQMDTTGFDMPMQLMVNGKKEDYEGKIFFMGIIDILQQYNIRKRFEAGFRRVQSRGWQDASCVNPEVYAERFVNFFDEYSKRNGPVASTNGASDTGKGEKDEQIVFEKDGNVKITGSSGSSEIEVSPVKE